MARHSTAPIHRHPTPHALAAAAAALLAAHAGAQTAAPPATQLEAVTVTGRASPPLAIGGWGDVPLAATPIQASIFDGAQWKDVGVQRLADLTRIDPAVSDAYNAEGYWDFLSVRGYVLDNRFNFLRDGLPINAETSIPLDNKARVEILKGTSGLQAGTSAPGGLVNYVVKRPLDTPLRSAVLEWVQPGTVTGAVDLSQRFGAGQAFGVRVNAAAAHLDPMVRNSVGSRHAFALAADWRASPDTLLEAEVETSHRSQPSQPGFSLLGDTVPPPADPRLSLNNQPWSLPVVFDATTASLRWQQKLAAGWSFTAHAATQRLRTDDRLAFPFGCTDPNPPPDGTYYADRFCPNGTYDLYDYRSEDERRHQDAIDLALRGRLHTGNVGHALTVGVLETRVRNRFGGQAYNFVGTGNIDGSAVTPPDPRPLYTNTNRDERSTELYARDAVALGERVTAWLGVRHSRLRRDSVQTDGTQATTSRPSFTSPSVALSFALARDQFVYASWGRGVETSVVPALPRYTNAGATFTTQSRQAEIGLKGASERFDWSVALFDIQRPRTQDFGSCSDDATCTTRLDGTAHHRGAEANAAWHEGRWALRGGAQWLRARVESSADAGVDGKQPPNVPARTLKLQGEYDVAALPGLNLQAGLAYESRRMALPDNSASIPGYARVDAALRYNMQMAGATTTWRAGVDNVLDRRAWRESPYQFSHAYLYPLSPRTLRLSVQVDL